MSGVAAAEERAPGDRAPEGPSPARGGGAAGAALVPPALSVAIAGAALILASVIAKLVADGGAQALDELLLREIARWKAGLGERAARGLDLLVHDASALGGWVVLSLLSVFAALYLALCGRGRDAALLAVIAAGGATVNELLKVAFGRPRPSVFPHATYVESASFPSGHAMMSMAIYVACGALLARLAPTRAGRAWAVSVGVLVALLVAASRCYLGVHYPTDVVAGSLVGLAWTLLALTTARAVEGRAAAAARGAEGAA